jgi:hypothetical protein
VRGVLIADIKRRKLCKFLETCSFRGIESSRQVEMNGIKLIRVRGHYRNYRFEDLVLFPSGKGRNFLSFTKCTELITREVNTSCSEIETRRFGECFLFPLYERDFLN